MNFFTLFKNTLLLAFVFSISMVDVTAQVYPFPQSANLQYQAGLLPGNVSDADAQAAYTYWKANFTTAAGACGYRRVIFDYFPGTTRGHVDKSVTVSEGIAYGMLLSAYFADKALFDDLWAYYLENTNVPWAPKEGVMNWRIRNCQPWGPGSEGGNNGASDAELDVAMALIVASYQWQDDSYKTDASQLIKVIREKEFDGDILKPGDVFGGYGDNLVNPSYFCPAYYRVFKDFDAPQYATWWESVAAKGYDIIETAGGTTGLVPDWTSATGGYAASGSHYEDEGRNFIYDGVRTPFRSALDALWHGNQDAIDYCNKFTTWAKPAHSNNPSNIGGKYATWISTDGTEGQKLDTYTNNTFIGCFGVAAMGTDASVHQQWTSDLGSQNKGTAPGYGEYFNSSFKAMTLLIQSGNFWLPGADECDAPLLGDDRSLCEGNITLDAFPDSVSTVYSFQWKKDGLFIPGAAGSGETYTATMPGVYEVIGTTTTGCVRRDKVEIFDGAIAADFTAVQGGAGIILSDLSTGGISNYTWTVTDPNGLPEVMNAKDTVAQALIEGEYTIRLEIDNAGFGTPACTDTDFKEVTLIVGTAGVAIDIFTDAWNNGFGMYSYGDAGNPFTNPFFVQTSCPQAGGGTYSKDTDPLGRCTYVDVEATGGAAAVGWASFAIDLFDADNLGSNPNEIGRQDLSAIPYVAVRLSATSAVDIQMGLQSLTEDGAGGYDQVQDLKTVSLTTVPTTITLDYSVATTLDLANIEALLLRPYAIDATWTGTISIDYVVFGAAPLPAPTFDIVTLPSGCTDYDAYVLDYRPFDPAFSACDVGNTPGNCYGDVLDWRQEITMCTATETLVANSCSATEVRWYKAGTSGGFASAALLGSGDTYEIDAPGKYYVQLLGAGPYTIDSVVVSGGDVPVASFTPTIEDQGYGVRLNNTSTGFTTFEWDYGHVNTNPDLAGNETWEEGYQYYGTYNAVSEITTPVADGTYTVCLTITDDICGATDTYCEDIDIECYSPFDPIAISAVVPNGLISEVIDGGADVDTIVMCPGDLSLETTSVGSTVFTGWIGNAGVLEQDVDILTDYAIAASQNIKFEAENLCGDRISDSIYVEVLAGAVAGIEEIQQYGSLAYGYTAKWSGAEPGTTYEWNLDGVAGTDSTGIYTDMKYNNLSEIVDVTLTVTNACGSVDTTFTPPTPGCQGILYSAVATATTGDKDSYCEQGDWTHYIDPVSNEIMFSINKQGQDFEITPEIGFLSPSEYTGVAEATYVMSRFWNVEVESGVVTSPVDIRFYINKSAELDQLVADITTFATDSTVAIGALEWFKSDDGNTFDQAYADANFTSAGLSGTYNLTAPTYGQTYDGIDYVQLSVAGFSGGSAVVSAGGSVALSTEFESFEVQASNGSVELSWSVANETAGTYAVLKSVDGVTYTTIATQVSGASAYAYTDESVVTGTTYYQVSYVGEDGSTVLTDAISVYVAAGNEATIAPNPSAEAFTLSVNNSAVAAIVVSDVSGQTIERLAVSTEVTFGAAYEQGVYFVSLIGASGETISVERVMKIK